VGQALHVSFLLEVLPVTQQTSTQILIDGLRKRCGVWDDQRAPSTINFSGLSPLEVRGQCALVRATVQDHLPSPERDAIYARFGHQTVKAHGVRGLAEYIGPLAGVQHQMALLAVTWSMYQSAKRVQDRWSFRAIEEETGVSKSQLHRAAQVIRQQAQALERRADERLTVLFEETELVVCEERDVQSA
jgi:hypothetical protein